MAKNLLIVESPAKSKTISKFLGKDYLIMASYGHIRDLPAYTLGVDLEQNFEPKYQTLRDKSKILKDLKSKSEKMDKVYIATDPDREGEAIAWHIKEALNLEDGKIKRIVFHEITKHAIQESFAHERDIDQHLVDAQQARRILDRLIGYKLSPILARKIRKGLSAGRVQSVAVKIICDREEQIDAFVPEEYWDISVTVTKDGDTHEIELKLFAQDTPKQKIHLHNEKEAKDVVHALNASSYTVDKITKKTVHRHPQPPFITSTLQQEASRKLNWGAKKTMYVAQQLYEGVDIGGETLGLITYMRTDSFRLSTEATSAAKKHIKTTYGDQYLPQSPRVYKKKKSMQDAHEAIRPTFPEKTPTVLKDALSPDHLKLYKLIWDRFTASQMASMDIDHTQVIVAATPDGSDTPYLLKATGNVVLFDGFSVLYSEGKDHPDEDDKHKTLPVLAETDPMAKKAIDPVQKFTQPPPRFTEATLVRELEEQGIGRPSTYAPTISTILDRGYIEREKKTLFPSDLGKLVNGQLTTFFPSIIDAPFTAKMETQLDEIIEGKHEWQNIVQEFYDPFKEKLERANTEMEKIDTTRPSDETCDVCGKPMVIKAGRFGDFLACSDFPSCKNTKSIIVTIGVPCPDCGGEIVEKRSRKGKVFYGCQNYPTCKFAAWDKPIAETCPDCQYPVMAVKTSKGKGEKKYCIRCQAKDK